MHKNFRADLHCHSTCSDGSDHPLALIQLAKEVGLQGLSITDHDTIDAYTPELLKEAEKLGIALLPGAEISSEFQDSSVHILGYGFDLQSNSLKSFLNEMQSRRTVRNRMILSNLRLKKMPISEEELFAFASERTVGRPHIAQLMVKKGYVATFKEAFDRFLKEGGSCYASGIKFSPNEVIREIQKAGGKAVLAHPHFMTKGMFLTRLLECPFDGIECYYSRVDKTLEISWLNIAQKKGWIATGGSDYHGQLKPHIPLGCSWVGEKTFNLLLNRADPNQ